MSDANAGLMTIFAEALDLADPAARAAYLDRACGADTALRQRAEALLAAHAGTGQFLEPDAGLATGFAAPRSSLGNARPVPLKEAQASADAAGLPAAPGYRVLHEIARGGMGRVLAGHDLTLDREVALKILLPGANARRFVRESKITARLSHPAVPPVHALGTLDDGSPFLAMKLIVGQTLAEQMKTADRPRLLQALLQVGQAVGFAHSRGIIHRDLKPSNVMVGDFGEVQVMDWGLAKDLGGRTDCQPGVPQCQRPQEEAPTVPGGDPNQTTDDRTPPESVEEQTQTGQVMGTPAYMAPEQARGEATDARADVFALGGMLCAILTGQPPFTGKSTLEVIQRAGAADLAETHARLDGCGADAELISLCRRCLSANPADRPADGQMVADELRAYLDGAQERLQTAQRERAVALTREAEQRKQWQVQLALAAAVLTLLLGTGAVAFWRYTQAQVGRERDGRNAEAVNALLSQAEEALRKGDAAKAALALDAAKRRSTEGGAEQEAQRLKRLGVDLALLRKLDAVDRFRWTVVDYKLPGSAAVAARTRETLAQFELDPEAVSMDEAAEWVSASAVRERVVSALDRLLRQEKRAGVRALLRRVDADPYRDAVRDAVLADDRAMMEKLVGKDEAPKQPAGFAAFLGESGAIPLDWRRQLLQAAVSQRPGDLGLLMTLGQTYQTNQKESADDQVLWYQAAVAAAPANYAAHINLGNALRDKGKVQEAIACYRKAIDLDQQDATAHHNLGAILCDVKRDYSGSIACFRKAIELDPKFTVSHLSLGNALKCKGEMDEAMACWRKAIDLDPKLAQAHINLGAALKVKGKVDEAIACFLKAVALAPKEAIAHNNLGNALVDKGKADEAMACWRKAIELDPKLAQAHLNLGNALKGKGQVDEAIECWRKTVALDRQVASAHYNLGNALYGKGNVDEAIECWRKAVDANPKLVPAHYNLGNALYGKGNVDEAIACFRKAVALDPKLASAHYNLGAALRNKGKAEEAIACIRKAIALDPTNAKAHNYLGAILCDVKRDYSGAIACFRKAIELDPTNAKAHNNLGAILCDVKRDYSGAIACFRKAIELDPKLAQAHLNLGNALKGKGEMDEAMACWRKAGELDPKLAHAHLIQGVALARQWKVDEAIACFRKAIALDPKLGRAHYNLGVLLQDKGKVDEAIACYQKSIDLDPKFATAHLVLGIALQDKGEANEAIACFRKAIALDPKLAQAHSNLGAALQDKGKLDEAIACFRKAIALDPKLAQAHSNLGVALDKKGQLDEAITCWRKAIALDPTDANAREGLPRAQRMAAVRDKLPAFLKGDFKPATNDERLGLAGWCKSKKLYGTAAGLYAAAFAADLKLADDLKAAHRYSAACSAALASAGQGEDAGKLDDKERTRLRRQALDWLKADLALRSRQMKSWWPGEATQARAALQRWQKDRDLAGIRDKDALAKLPAQEQKAFTPLWSNVAALLKKVETPAAKEGKR